MKDRVISIVSWLIVLWTAKVFLSSIPYKFSGHPDTQHIFGTIGEWMKGILGESFGQFFVNNGAVLVGSVELFASIVLLSPALFFLFSKTGLLKRPPARSLVHAIGGLMAAAVMTGAVFFHLVTPLGIEVLHQGKSDGGSLFFAALSIVILGYIMSAANLMLWKSSKN